jgi:hypothetical protein
MFLLRYGCVIVIVWLRYRYGISVHCGIAVSVCIVACRVLCHCIIIVCTYTSAASLTLIGQWAAVCVLVWRCVIVLCCCIAVSYRCALCIVTRCGIIVLWSCYRDVIVGASLCVRCASWSRYALSCAL